MSESSAAAGVVSVIIPTVNRPQLVLRAIRSVLAQTLAPLEIIVVIDGPDPVTARALQCFAGHRVWTMQLQQRSGPGAARNRGAASASGTWLAFLDDDDEWLPMKLERQLQAAAGRIAFISCQSYVETPAGREVWPRQPYSGTIPVDEYLFDRQSLFRGHAHFGTSTFLLPASLFARTGFSTDRHHEDTTLLLRVAKLAGADVLMVPEPLVILQKRDPSSLGSQYDWREMLGWVDGMRPLITRRAYSGFCLIYLGSQAARRRDVAAFPLLLWRAFRRGSPRLLHVLPFLGFWVVPTSARQRLRHWSGKRPQAL